MIIVAIVKSMRIIIPRFKIMASAQYALILLINYLLQVLECEMTFNPATLCNTSPTLRFAQHHLPLLLQLSTLPLPAIPQPTKRISTSSSIPFLPFYAPEAFVSVCGAALLDNIAKPPSPSPHRRDCNTTSDSPKLITLREIDITSSI